MTITVQDAKNLINKLKENEIALGRDPNTWYTYENHVYGTAQIAQMIASEIKMMNPNRLYIMGLLHDISRTEEDRFKRFHGILGFEKFISTDPDIARTCLLHMFPWNKLPAYESCSGDFYDQKDDYQFVSDFIQNNPPVDEDYLIQLCDNLANKNGFVTIEERLQEYHERHKNEDISHLLIVTNELKKYFENKIGHSIYDFFALK